MCLEFWPHHERQGQSLLLFQKGSPSHATCAFPNLCPCPFLCPFPCASAQWKAPTSKKVAAHGYNQLWSHRYLALPIDKDSRDMSRSGITTILGPKLGTKSDPPAEERSIPQSWEGMGGSMQVNQTRNHEIR